MLPIRFLLMVVLLAFLPFQAWAGFNTSASVAGPLQAAQMDKAQASDSPLAAQGDSRIGAQRHVGLAADQADFATPSLPASDSSHPCDSADPSSPGADFAEQLLPAPMPRVSIAVAPSVVPHYAVAALPDPHLPLLPRPPRG
ncbi:hypothetical protein [Cupriavidus pauculus]|uniref:hypothetical protein n=1 Tax=Cupriavidus pauculus TaxID=82633 RepID=UPI001CC13CAE|nr:hypothetical protein [Cupriavidus pauculus]MCM3603937.1 hypothetical protein [Cupriavidus pauculus]